MSETYSQVTDDDIRKLIDTIIEKDFKNLTGSIIEPIFLNKKKMSKGKYQLATLSKPNSLIKHIFKTINGNDVDYILFFDVEVYYQFDDRDKNLIISHALEFADVDMEKDNPYTLRGAEVETFYDEIERNKEDTQWQQRHQDIAEQHYTKDE